MLSPANKQQLLELLAYILESERDRRSGGSAWCKAIRLVYDLGRTDGEFFALWNQYKHGESPLTREVAFMLRR